MHFWTKQLTEPDCLPVCLDPNCSSQKFDDAKLAFAQGGLTWSGADLELRIAQTSAYFCMNALRPDEMLRYTPNAR